MKKEMFWVIVLLVFLNIVIFFGLAKWWQNHHIQAVIVSVPAQTNAVAVTTVETNLVPSGTNGPGWISLKGKIRAGWGESK